jgi:hypothetical protein
MEAKPKISLDGLDFVDKPGQTPSDEKREPYCFVRPVPFNAFKPLPIFEKPVCEAGTKRKRNN